MKALGTIELFKDFKTKDDMEIIINVPGHVADQVKTMLGGRVKPGESRWVEMSLFTGEQNDTSSREGSEDVEEVSEGNYASTVSDGV